MAQDTQATQDEKYQAFRKQSTIKKLVASGRMTQDQANNFNASQSTTGGNAVQEQKQLDTNKNNTTNIVDTAKNVGSNIVDSAKNVVNGVKSVFTGSTTGDTTNRDTVITPDKRTTPISNNNVDNTVNNQNNVNTTQDKRKTIEPTVRPTENKAINTNGQGIDYKDMSIDDYRESGSNMSDLEQMVEARYGTMATVGADGNLTAEIDGKTYKWVNNKWGDPEKKLVTTPQTSQDIYARLMEGEEITDPNIVNTAEYTKAKAASGIVKKYQGMSSDALYNAYVNGEIGGQLEQLMGDNPNLAIAKEKYNEKLANDYTNNTAKNTLNALNKVNGNNTAVTETKTELEKINDKMVDLMTNMGKSDSEIASFGEYMGTNYPDLESKTLELNAKNKLLKEKTDSRNDRLEELIKENPGISPNRATMLASKQNEALNDEIKTMTYELANLSSDIQYQTTLANTEYGYALQAQSRSDALDQEQRGYIMNALNTQQSQAYQAQQTSEARDYNASLTADDRAYNASLTADQRNYEQFSLEDTRAYQQEMTNDQRAYEQANQDVSTSFLTDPATGKTSLINTQTGAVIKSYNTSNSVSGSTSTADWARGTDGVIYNKRTGETKEEGEGVTNTDYSGLDFSTNKELLAEAYTGREAGVKNNNPTGITWGVSNNLKGLWDDAGIDYSKGTNRPTGEGGNYVKFATVEDGMKAYKIALTQASWDDVDKRLQQWVVGNVSNKTGADYATSLMAEAGIEKGYKFSELSETQIDKLLDAQMKRESPVFRKGLLAAQQEQTTQNVEETNDTSNGVSDYAKTWVDAWNNGTMDLETILTKIGSSKESLSLKNEVMKYVEDQGGVAWRKEDDAAVTKVKAIGATLDDILDSNYLHTIAGGVQSSPLNFITGGKSDVLADIRSVLAGETLQSLINAKSNGATFGALSAPELQLLKATATKLAANAITDDEDRIIGFDMSEGKLKKELENLRVLYYEKVDRMTGGETIEDSSSDGDVAFDKYY